MICPEPAFRQPTYDALLQYEVRRSWQPDPALCNGHLAGTRGNGSLSLADLQHSARGFSKSSPTDLTTASLQASQTKLFKAAQSVEGMPRSELTAEEYATDDFRMFHFKVKAPVADRNSLPV